MVLLNGHNYSFVLRIGEDKAPIPLGVTAVAGWKREGMND